MNGGLHGLMRCGYVQRELLPLRLDLRRGSSGQRARVGLLEALLRAPIDAEGDVFRRDAREGEDGGRRDLVAERAGEGGVRSSWKGREGHERALLAWSESSYVKVTSESGQPEHPARLSFESVPDLPSRVSTCAHGPREGREVKER